LGTCKETGSLNLLYFIIIKIRHLLLHQPLKIQILQLVLEVDEKMEIMESLMVNQYSSIRIPRLTTDEAEANASELELEEVGSMDGKSRVLGVVLHIKPQTMKEVSIGGSHRLFQQSSTCIQLSYEQDESSAGWKTACMKWGDVIESGSKGIVQGKKD
jgi:hypothetical protein